MQMHITNTVGSQHSHIQGINTRITLGICRVPTVGASVARHNYKKILVEKTSTFIVVTTGTQEHRKIGTRGKDTAPISSI